MGCGCKDKKVTTVRSQKDETPLTIKEVLTKTVTVVAASIGLVILTPVIIVLLWYYGINVIFNRDYDIIMDLANRLKTDNPMASSHEDVENLELDV